MLKVVNGIKRRPDSVDGPVTQQPHNSDWIPDFPKPFKTPWKDSAFSDGLETIGISAILFGLVFFSTVHPSNPLVGAKLHRPDWIMWPTQPLTIGLLSLVAFMIVRNDKAKLKLLSQFQIGFTLAIGFASLWLFYRR